MLRKCHIEIAWILVLVLAVLLSQEVLALNDSAVTAPGANVEKLAGGFSFTEGPAVDGQGNIYFTDIPNNRIHKWSLDGKLTTFRENSGEREGPFGAPCLPLSLDAGQLPRQPLFTLTTPGLAVTRQRLENAPQAYNWLAKAAVFW